MNDMTQAVVQYKKTKGENDFKPIWNHFEPKLRLSEF